MQRCVVPLCNAPVGTVLDVASEPRRAFGSSEYVFHAVMLACICMQLPGLQQPFGLAHSMTTLAGSGEDKTAAPVPEHKLPASMMALPPRKQ